MRRRLVWLAGWPAWLERVTVCLVTDSRTGSAKTADRLLRDARAYLPGRLSTVDAPSATQHRPAE
jgi:hypothetical protein